MIFLFLTLLNYNYIIAKGKQALKLKNFKNLGKILSKTELTKVKGGYIDPGGDAILCKATTTKCKVYNLNGTYQDGTCDTAPASGPRLSYCGCKVGTEIQEATECKP